MLELDKGHHRLLYVIAKAAGPIKKRDISHQTQRWRANHRDLLLTQLERAELIVRQHVPGKVVQQSPMAYWLTPAGVETVDNLESAGKIQTLPAHWREFYVKS